ncbi:MAG: hypothetical protein JWO72_1185 [Caulobacteraceae bacterium]|nr:hypothetical protein [Caulobacteraceae bacterium]
MRRHGDNPYRLRRVLSMKGFRVDCTTLRTWRLGVKSPAHRDSLAILGCLEARWRLPAGYFRSKLPRTGRATKGHDLPGLPGSERRRIAWHLPDDFDDRPREERDEIVAWVRRVIVSGATDYRRYQAAALKQPFAVRFPGLHLVGDGVKETIPDGGRAGNVRAPAQLAAEMAELIEFKTATLTRLGYRRSGVWGKVTALQKVKHLGLMFGALVASPAGPVSGRGIPLSSLSSALLVLPSVWDWYLRWREQRRGFYTAWETDMLANAAALTHPETGWLTQTPGLVSRLGPVPGLATEEEVLNVGEDWKAACGRLYEFALARGVELRRATRVHRDPFEAVLAVLEAESPVAEYRKIADEILRLAPCARRYPKAAAEAARSYLMIRLGLHLGFREKNLRQLLICRRGDTPTPERRLVDSACGELRWSERDEGWEVFVPANAFKNANSSFFGKRPFRLLLPDLGDLYAHIERYVGRHRPVLLGPRADPGTFFVKSGKGPAGGATYNQTTFYEAWRWTIQRYGTFNPYTGRGAIPGLLPHGPHNVRDVLATHILKQTGSYEQASYAIQDTPEMVANHYGRFLPADKAAIAAQILNRVWE